MIMNILERLAVLASKLDSKGLYEEADMLDAFIKEAQDFPPGWQSVHNFPEDVITVDRPKGTHDFPPDTIKGRYRPGHWRQLDRLRSMFGLKPGLGFDAQLAMKLRQLNQKYPGVWVPGAKQKVSEIMANVQQAQQKAKEFEYAQQQQPKSEVAGIRPSTTLPSGSRAPAPQSISPDLNQLFPRQSPPPDVSLGPKKEYFPE